MINTSDFIEELVSYCNQHMGCEVYFDRAPIAASFPYCVISGIGATDLAAGDLTNFDFEIYTDEKKANAIVQAEAMCDRVRNLLHNCTLRKTDVFGCHVAYESRQSIEDKEYDLATRRLYFSARIFYN